MFFSAMTSHTMTSPRRLPIDPALYARVKREAGRVFQEKTSAYRSAWIVRRYQTLGGKFDDKRGTNGGLKRWFAEKWVDLNRRNKADGSFAPCGRPASRNAGTAYPLCRPTVRVSAKTPLTVSQLSKQGIDAAKRQKAKVRGEGRVSTFRRRDQSSKKN